MGDGHFQQKCMRRIKAFRASGGSIIFISHDLNAMKMLCDRCIVLSEGRVVADDTPEAAVNRYNQLLGADREELEVEAEESGYGTGEARIESAVLRGVSSGSDTLACGDVAHLDVRVSAREHLPDATLGMMIRDRFGQDIYGTNSFLLGVPLVLAAGETRCCATNSHAPRPGQVHPDPGPARRPRPYPPLLPLAGQLHPLRSGRHPGLGLRWPLRSLRRVA